MGLLYFVNKERAAAPGPANGVFPCAIGRQLTGKGTLTAACGWGRGPDAWVPGRKGLLGLGSPPQLPVPLSGSHQLLCLRVGAQGFPVSHRKQLVTEGLRKQGPWFSPRYI